MSILRLATDELGVREGFAGSDGVVRDAACELCTCNVPMPPRVCACVLGSVLYLAILVLDHYSCKGQ